MFTIQMKRIYTAPEAADGYRVLVDRLWPRGIRKTEAGLDDWVRADAPSTALRKSFAHQPERFQDFQKAYRAELDQNPDALNFVHFCEAVLSSRNVTLLYAAKDETYNNAAVLLEWLQDQLYSRSSACSQLQASRHSSAEQ